ncbi:MAG: hypothetical protein AMJ53_14230 [Gammaproteobacteria bacterium SG8_11]|nr:MAG: hypothetical protein AMJ53_14230 [Gammaproteobacteria bacterium SG8_11]
MNMKSHSLISNFTFLAVGVLISGSIVYALLNQDNTKTDMTFRQPDLSTPSINQVTSSLDRLKADIMQNLHTYREEAKLENARVNAQVAKLEGKLQALEIDNAASGRTENLEELPDNEPVVEVWAAEAARSPLEERVTESALRNWIDNSFELGYVDETLTARAEEQAVSSLVDLPDIYMQDLQCSERVCRATFSHETGKGPTVLDVFGHPPFMTEGITVPIDHERVAVYFTQPGVSFDELRSEVDVD